MKKIIYVDMDDVLADFYRDARDFHGKVEEHRMWNDNFFLNLKPTPGAQGAMFDLEKMGFDVYIASQPLAESPNSYTEKAKWVQLHFPQFYKKLVLTQNKGLLLGDYLIDDNAKKWKESFERNGGKFIHFPYGGYNQNPTRVVPPNPEGIWRSIIEDLRGECDQSGSN
jgi:5'(3')-deoxyribonucleotidase